MRRAVSVPEAQNQLIQGLPKAHRQRLLSLCQAVPLTLSDVLCESGMPTKHAYFPTDGFISLVATIEGSPGVEVGMAGREGMLGAHLALGVATHPLRALVQGSGMAWRIDSATLRRELSGNPTLQRRLNRYLYVLMEQQATSAACLRFHHIGQRLARWLLMSQDRAHADRFHLTHVFLGYMLGVRREGITAAAASLQRAGLIDYHRGDVGVLDRNGLEAAACSCYAAHRKSYSTYLT